jgi:uncharacterized membrane protein YkvA (DUF1232 family)
MGEFLKKSLAFVKALSLDDRIPAWDKAVLAGMVALLVSPIDIISDFIPLLGQLDDVVIAILLLDYVVNRLPEAILLAHWPWDPAKLSSWRKRLRFLSLLVPAWARDRIWAVQEVKAREAGEASAGAQGVPASAAGEKA